MVKLDMQVKNSEFKLWLKQHKMFWWWVPDVTKLSEDSILEGVMSYGDWEDFLKLKKWWGMKKIKGVFKQIISRKRVNLRPATRNLFANYLSAYAA